MPPNKRNTNPRGNRRAGRNSTFGRNANPDMMRCPKQPPTVQSNLESKLYTLTYVSAAAISTTCTPSQIGSFLTTGGGALFVYKYVNAVKVHHVSMWAAPPAGGNPQTLSIQFNGVLAQVVGPNRSYTDTSIGFTYAARLRVRPPRDSTAAAWLPTGGGVAPGTSPLFAYSSTGAFVIQICCEFSGSNDDTFVSTIATSNVTTNGQTYALALDHGVSDNVVPQSVITIT